MLVYCLHAQGPNKLFHVSVKEVPSIFVHVFGAKNEYENVKMVKTVLQKVITF